MTMKRMTQQQTRKIVKFCAIECEHQQSGEMSVYNMLEAWFHCRKLYSLHSLNIAELGRLVEPTKNGRGFRTVNVMLDWQPISWQNIERNLEWLCSADNLEPGIWYREFEMIHPFVDGNGRVGVLLYNWLRKTLDDPTPAPDYFNERRKLA